MTDTPNSPHEAATTEPVEPPASIQSRFLFVDVAAQRAKQLRRGARVRLGAGDRAPHKLERAAMEEVRQQLVHYSVPAVPSQK
jgi:DNA-directed RNA polymerase subunit K/omega